MFSINETYSTENYNITLFPVLCVQMLKTKCYSKNLSKNVHARVFSFFSSLCLCKLFSLHFRCERRSRLINRFREINYRDSNELDCDTRDVTARTIEHIVWSATAPEDGIDRHNVWKENCLEDTGGGGAVRAQYSPCKSWRGCSLIREAIGCNRGVVSGMLSRLSRLREKASRGQPLLPSNENIRLAESTTPVLRVCKCIFVPIFLPVPDQARSRMYL